MRVFIYFAECEESSGQFAVDSLAEMLIFASRSKVNIIVAVKNIYSALSIAFDACFEANSEIIYITKRKGAVVF